MTLDCDYSTNEEGKGTPEAVQARIHALHAENVRLSSEKSSLSQKQGSAAASEKQLQAEILTLRKQAMLHKRQHTSSEQKVSQLQRDLEFERFQKKGLQQLVDTFASAPADEPEEDEEEEGAKKPAAGGSNPAGAAGDAATLAGVTASLKKCEARIEELEGVRVALEATKYTPLQSTVAPVMDGHILTDCV